MTDNRLLLIVERIERLIEERKGITDDIRDVYAEAKGSGYDARMIRKMIQRRAMNPQDRQETDALLETYEAALGMDDEQLDATLAELRPDAMLLATEMLAAEIIGLEDPQHAAQLVEHVLFILDTRAEIRELQRQVSERKKLAKAERFDPNQISVTVRWIEKCAKHGTESMQAGEATFHLYRGTMDQHRASLTPVTQDAKLGAMFAPPPVKPKKSTSTLARLRAEAAETRRALGGE